MKNLKAKDYEKYPKKYKHIIKLVESKLRPKRFRHSMGVAWTALDLAMEFDADLDDAFVAGLCHDIAKQMPEKDMLALVKKSPFKDDKDLLETQALWHAAAGAVYLKKLQNEYPEFNNAVIEACQWHTLGTADMKKLSKIIFLADMIEPNRDYDEVAEIKIATYENLNFGMATALSKTLEYFKVGGQFIHPKAYEAYEFYKIHK